MHPFICNLNILIFVALVLALAADAYSTQRFLSAEVEARHGNDLIELNPVARPFVTQGWPGQILISSLGLILVITVSFTLHLHGHHVAERVPPLLVAAVSGLLAFHNMQF